MKTVAPLLMARMASLCKEVLGGRTPLASRWTMVRGRERSCVSLLGVSHWVLGSGGEDRGAERGGGVLKCEGDSTRGTRKGD